MRLGLWDGRSPYEGGVFGDGLSGSHEIAIWQVDRPLSPLVSSLIPAGMGAALVSGFRYISISPVTLLAGRDYVIGAEYHDGQDPMARDLDNPRFTLTVSPEIEFGGYRWGPWEGALAFPEHYHPGSLAHFGPNFTFIPEPPPFALVLVAICAGAWRLRQA